MLETAALPFDRDAGLFAQLDRRASPGLVHPLPAGLKVGRHEEQGLVFTHKDRNGQPLTFTTTVDFGRMRAPDDIAPWNRPILAFLLVLPSESRIVLFWC